MSLTTRLLQQSFENVDEWFFWSDVFWPPEVCFSLGNLSQRKPANAAKQKKAVKPDVIEVGHEIFEMEKQQNWFKSQEK